MAKRTVHMPDELDREVTDFGSTDDSYSGIVQDALREYLDNHSGENRETARAN